MSGKKPEQSSTGLTQEKIEVQTIEPSAGLPPFLKYHFFQISKDAVYPLELYKPGSRERVSVKNVSEFVTKMFATMHCVLVPGASASDFNYPKNYGTLNLTSTNPPSWLPGAKDITNQTEIGIDSLLNGFKKNLEQGGQSVFNFSLVSSNHAHNLPVAFAFYAFNNAMKHQLPKEEAGKCKRIVINFDYHPDTSLPTKTTKSAAWGGALFYNELNSIADLYISIGNDGDQNSHTNTITYILPIVKNKLGVKVLTQFKSSFSLDQIKDFGAVWNHIKEKAGVDKDHKALVYITWDRDVGSDGFTDWTLSNKPLDRGDVNTSICNCVTLIEKDHGIVVGFDVTGLPDNVLTIRENCVQQGICNNTNASIQRDFRYGGLVIPKEYNAEARNYYFTMMKDISNVLHTLKDCQYLLCARASASKPAPARPSSPHPTKPASASKPAPARRTRRPPQK